MADGYEVDIPALRKEAPKWDGFTRSATPVRTAVEDAYLAPTAFFCGDPAIILAVGDVTGQAHQVAYESYRNVMSSLIDGAIAEFPQIRVAMTRLADAYENHEKNVETNLDKFYDAKNWK